MFFLLLSFLSLLSFRRIRSLLLFPFFLSYFFLICCFLFFLSLWKIIFRQVYVFTLLKILYSFFKIYLLFYYFAHFIFIYLYILLFSFVSYTFNSVIYFLLSCTVMLFSSYLLLVKLQFNNFQIFPRFLNFLLVFFLH